MMPCFESHVSLEFITDVAEGLLLYSGPLAQLQAWDHEDFMALGMKTTKHQTWSLRLRTKRRMTERQLFLYSMKSCNSDRALVVMSRFHTGQYKVSPTFNLEEM